MSRARIVINLELAEDDDGGLVDAIVADLPAVFGRNNNDDIIESWEVDVVDLEASTRVLVTGNPVDGIRLTGPVPDHLDAGDINDTVDFGDQDWWLAPVEPWPL